MKVQYTWINGEWVAAGEAALYVNDLSIQRGYGIFDFLKLVGNKPLFLEDHLDRFFQSASQMRLPVGIGRDELKTVIATLAEKNQVPDAGIRFTLTGGYSPDAYTPASPNLIITQQPLVLPDFTAGIRVMTYEYQRQLPSVKTIDYLMAIWLQPLIEEKQAADVLYHQNGVITECPRSNFFIVTADDEIWTPAAHMLKGVVRKQLLQLAGQEFVIREQTVTLADVRVAREAFVTSTTKNILPVLQVDDQQIGNGTPGPITRRLKDAFNAVVQNI